MSDLIAIEKRLDALVLATERVAKANEDLIALAREERDFGEQVENQPGPPYCPHCQRVDPVVNTESVGGGLLSDFVLVMQCSHCNANFYGLSEGWIMALDIDNAIELRNARRVGTSEHVA